MGMRGMNCVFENKNDVIYGLVCGKAVKIGAV
jgi:hypothetical protein